MPMVVYGNQTVPISAAGRSQEPRAEVGHIGYIDWMDHSVASQGRVLVVDSEPGPESYAAQLEETGFVVTKARLGAEAIRLVDSAEFDVVLSDLRLPDLDGLSLARHVHDRSADTPVILLAESAVTGAVRQAVAASGLELLTKPISSGSLRRATSRAVRRRAGLVFDNRKGEEVDLTSFNASEAKNVFGKVLETALREGATVIRKHEVPKAVLLSWAEFSSLAAMRRAQLDALTAEFDGLLAHMQTPSARVAMKTAFDASPDQLGEAAVKAARRRG